MTIVFTYPTMLHPIRGGVERVTDILAKGFARRGHRVVYLINKHSAELEGYDYPGEVVFFPEEDYHAQANHEFYRSFLIREQVDFVINQCGGYEDSTLYCDTKGTGTKVISCVHMNPLELYPNLLSTISRLRNNTFVEKLKRIARVLIYPKIKRDYYRRLVRQYAFLENNTDKLVLLSDSFKSEASLLNENVKAEVIPNPLPPQTNSIEQIEKENIILWVGRMDMKQKRPDRMIRIWERLHDRFPDWRLVMVGDGDCRKQIEYSARHLPRISFTGFVNPTCWYSKAKIMCMTSTFEGFGMVLIEGMSQGVVPIAFNSYSSLNDIIHDERQKVAPFSINEYVQKLSVLMQNSELLNELRAQSIVDAEDFHIDKILDKWENLFAQIHSV